MHYGIVMFPTDYAIRPDELARLLEERGFESYWAPEHTHIPASRRTPWPGGPDLPKDYWHTFDPFVALTAAAAATSTLKVATGICLVIERDPITLAKEVASLDMISNGRFLFGIGGGWNLEEMENHGTKPKQRWRLLRENVLAMQEIWTQEEAEFHGDLVDFDPVWAYPKPVQQPYPPVIVGGDGPRTLDRVAEFGDGWMPILGRRSDGPPLEEKIAMLRAKVKERGRDPDAVSVSIFGARPDREALDKLEAHGVERAIFMLPAADRETVLPLIDRYAEFVR